MFSRKEQWIIFGIINGLVLTLLLLFPLYFKYARYLPASECVMPAVFHLYCPGCGGTRAFKALTELNIFAAFKYNPVVPVGAGFFVAYEVYMIKHLIKKTERKTFIKLWMPLVFLGFYITYFVVRNVLLINGIDLLGDIIK